MSDINKKQNYLTSPLKTFWFAISPFKVRFFCMCGLIVIGNLAGNSLPYFFKLIADTVVERGTAVSFSDLLPAVWFITAALIIGEVAWRIGHIIETYTAPEAFGRVTHSLYGGLIKRPTSYFEDKFSGDLGRRIEQIGSSTMYFIQDFPWGMGWIVGTVIATGILLGFTNIYIVLTFVIWLVLFLITAIPLLWLHGKRSEKLAASHAQLSGNIIDAIGNAPIIHSFGGAAYEQELNRKNVSDVVSVERSVRWASIYNKIQQGVSVILLTISLVVVSVILFSKGIFTVGDFVIVAATIPSMISVIWNLGDMILHASRQFGEFSDAVAKLREKQEQLQGGQHSVVESQSYSITFQDILFQYPGTQDPVFKDFSFVIKNGERVGIVGPSGVGKSTLVKLLLRQYNAQKGVVAVGDMPIEQFSLDTFNKLISYVPQDTSLFHRTLFENIYYANPKASKEAVLKASKEAHAEEFIKALPEKYDTKVGERGVKLSGGQRQRIALARAILKNAPILILDEATSSLDSESESAIQETLSLLFKDRTVVAIAHRLSTLRAMDRIVVVGAHGIVESGTPQELLDSENSIFKKMWEHQKNGFV